MVKDFVDDRNRLCINQIQAGGVGVSLGDIHGVHPRFSLISPPPSARDYVQAIGRIWRATSKTISRQYLFLAQDTVEEKIAARLLEKTENIDALQDADFWN